MHALVTEETKSSSKLLDNNLNVETNPLGKSSDQSDQESEEQFEEEDEENFEDYDQE